MPSFILTYGEKSLEGERISLGIGYSVDEVHTFLKLMLKFNVTKKDLATVLDPMNLNSSVEVEQAGSHLSPIKITKLNDLDGVSMLRIKYL